jgi:predicted peptidase
MNAAHRLTLPLLVGGIVGLATSACQESLPVPGETAVPPLPDAAMIPGIHEQLLPPGELHYTIAIPEGYTGDQPVPLILALHYGGQVTPFYGKGLLVGLVEPALSELGAIIVAPDNAAGDWTNPQSEANVLILLDAIQATYNIDQRRTLITGYSLGGMGTWYLAARHQERFAAALPISGRPQADSADFDWTIPLYILHSRDDGLIPLAPTEAIVNQLAEKGVDVQLVILEGITHYETYRFVPPLRATIPWIESAWR